MADRLRIPMANRDHRPLDMQMKEARDMGIAWTWGPIIRQETEQEAYLRFLEETMHG